MLDEEEYRNSTYIYLRLTPEQPKEEIDERKDKFTPERLLGVLIDHGYIQDVGIRYVTTTGYHYCDKNELKYYISDENDETVSFDEYVKMFYDVE